MALQTPCTGKEIIDEINSVSNEINDSKERINTQMQTAIDDGYHISDLIKTSRTDLGDKYLLCNGDVLYNWGEYSEVIPYIDGDSKIWYHSYSRSNDYLYAVDSVIYRVYASGLTIYIVKFDSLQNFVEGIGSNPVEIYTYAQENATDSVSITIKGGCKCFNRFYLWFNIDSKIKLITTPLNNPFTIWHEALSIDNTDIFRYSLVHDNKCMCFVSVARRYLYNSVGEIRSTSDYLQYRVTLDGVTFSDTKETEINTNTYPLYSVASSMHSGRIFVVVSVTNGYGGEYSWIYTSYLNYSSKEDLIGTWTCIENPFNSGYGGRTYGMVVGHDDGYAYVCVEYLNNGTGYIYRVGDSSLTRFASNTYRGSLYSRDGNLYMLISGDSQIARVHFSTDGAYSGCYYISSYERKEYGFSSLNVTPMSESDDMYIYYNEIVPKEDGVIASLPTISSNVGYTYIKAKE